MTQELDIRIVLDDTSTIIGAATVSLNGDVTLENPAFLIPDERGQVGFIPALLAMGIDESETEIFITKDKLKFGKSFLASKEMAQAYAQTMGYSNIELPAEKKLIL